MIESTKFKKMLHLLKTNSKDLNIDVSIIDYDTMKECDYEVLILHLKETNTQNGATVYKDFIIRSQLYYDEVSNKYYSALDGDILVVGKALSKINILTTITDATFSNDNVQIQVQLVDADTLEPIKNQSLFLYLSSTPEESVASVTTDKNGKATFSFYLSNTDIIPGENILHIEYKGNNTYRATKSAPFLVNVGDIKVNNITSNLNGYIDTTEYLHLTYSTSLNNKSLSDGFKDFTELEIDEQDLISGKVLFYIDNVLIGESTLFNEDNKTYSMLTIPYSNQYYNKTVYVQAIFEGNDYFSMDIAGCPIEANRLTPTNQVLEVIQPDVSQKLYQIRLSFDVPDTFPSSEIYEIGHETAYRTGGVVQFYIKNKRNTWGTINEGAPFETTTNFNITHENNKYTISTTNDLVALNKNDYLLEDNDSFRVKAIYSGNTIIDGFEIENAYYYNMNIFIHKGISENAVDNASVSLQYETTTEDSNTHETVTELITYKTTTSDENGYCHFYNIPLRNYIIKVEKEGYITKSVRQLVSQDVNVDIELTKENWSGD